MAWVERSGCNHRARQVAPPATLTSSWPLKPHVVWLVVPYETRRPALRLEEMGNMSELRKDESSSFGNLMSATHGSLLRRARVE